jgi:hypothetical protein
MPVTTRTRTGKLPVRVSPILQHFSEIDDEILPRENGNEITVKEEENKTVAKDEETEEVKDSSHGYTSLDGSTLIEQAAAPERSPPKSFLFKTFTTFKSKSHLRDGLNLVRHLGGGRYEIVNLHHVSPNVMGSEDVGHYLRDDPKRLELFDQAKEGFANSKLSIEQAAHSASKSNQ